MDEMILVNNELSAPSENAVDKELEIAMLKNKLAVLTAEMNQFSYIVSHDLQAPLRMVTGFLELLEKKHGEKLDDSAKQYIGYAVKGAAKMKNLVFDLLEYSRLNVADLEKTDVNLQEVMTGVGEKFASEIEMSGIKVNISSLPTVFANKKQMTQLFEQLFSNAVKFRSDELPEIMVNAKLENENWVFCVQDNGIGIDAAFFEKIFIIFRKLVIDETKYPGTGVGLTICKKIVELHSGSIWLESAPGLGTKLYFSLPDKK